MQERLNEINQRLDEILSAPQNAARSDEFITLFEEKQRLSQSPSPDPKNPPRENQRRENQRRGSSMEARLTAQPRGEAQSGSILANVNRELAKLERRDWELWWIVSATGILMGGGLIAILLPAAFMKTENFHFEITVPRQLVVGLMVLLILINTYLVTRRIDLRRLRQKMVSSTIQNELVRLQSFTDPLTEIYNRRSLEDLVNRYISHARRLEKPLTFLLIDVDRFKQINTRFGHLTGDFVLVEIAGLLRNSIRGCDAVIRYGGDEFLTIVSDASAEEARKVVERMQASVNDWNKGAHLDDCNISLSIGVAEWTDGKTIDEVLDLADQDMYAKKGEPASQSPQKTRAATTAS
ncbi:MAG: GGDEF domain-containing protein [Terriglobales bacterium]